MSPSAKPAAASPGDAEPTPALERAPHSPIVLLVGNPNVGKTTLFNALTGQSARVGNYPGVTVERRAGVLTPLAHSTQAAAQQATLVDVPGTVSLCARSADEQISIQAVLGMAGNPQPDLVCVVMDAGQVTRNAYLLLQLIELQVPLLVILNMIDEVAARPPQSTALSSLFGVPCVATNARMGQGIDDLRAGIFAALAQPTTGQVSVSYPAALSADVDRVADALPSEWRRNVERDRALSRWALCSIDRDDELDAIPEALRQAVLDAQSGALQEVSGVRVALDEGSPPAATLRDLDQEMIAARYAWLDHNIPRLYQTQPPAQPAPSLTDRIDRVLLHPVFGFAIFVMVMLFLFQSLFSWAEPAINLTEDGVALLQRGLTYALPPSLIRDALVEGVIGGVGNVVVFLPQIVLLFLFIGVLEDSGYMARVAYLMDRVLRGVGLHGRAFVPMLSGFACAIPAILATRTMERQRDRLLTMLVVPLMSCSARLPVYSLVIAALFPPSLALGFIPVQGLLMVSMYVFSIVMTLLAAWVLGRTTVKGRRIPLILELPRYRMPKLSGVLRMTRERALSFLKEAGTLILAFTMILWVLLSFPRQDAAAAAQHPIATQAQPESAATAIEQSYGGRMGKAIEPALEPLGFDWKIGIGLIGAFAAREVFVSTMGLVYGLSEVSDDDTTSLRERVQAEKKADGTPRYTPLVGLSLMIFFALACQCMSTLAVVRRETKSWRWPLFLFGYMTALAYGVSLIVFQVGSLFGF